MLQQYWWIIAVFVVAGLIGKVTESREGLRAFAAVVGIITLAVFILVALAVARLTSVGINPFQ